MCYRTCRTPAGDSDVICDAPGAFGHGADSSVARAEVVFGAGLELRFLLCRRGLREGWATVNAPEQAYSADRVDHQSICETN